MNQLDTDLFLFLNGDLGSVVDQLMWFASKTWPWIPVYAILIYTIYKRFSLKLFLLAVVGIALCVFLSDRISFEFLKNTVMRLRPSRVPELQGMIHHVKDANGNFYIGGMYGFVSSHAANYAAIITFYLLIMRPVKRWLVALLIAWCLLISYSRIYLGVHYPGDILGGYVLGIVIAFLVYGLYKLAAIRITS